jgi:hypothetical protein
MTNEDLSNKTQETLTAALSGAALADIKNTLKGEAPRPENPADRYKPVNSLTAEQIVKTKIADVRTELQAIGKSIEQRAQLLDSKLQALHVLMAEVANLHADIGHLKSHRIGLELSNLMHNAGLKEIAVQG